MNMIEYMGNDPFSLNMDTSLNFGLNIDTSLELGLNMDMSLNMDTDLNFKLKSDVHLDFDRMGGLEVAKVTEFEDESISMFSTNSRNRDFNRKKVVYSGAVPQVGQRVVMYKRTPTDAPVCIGMSAWLND